MITYEIDAARSMAFVDIRDTLADADAIEWFEKFLVDATPLRSLSGVVDTRSLTTFEMSAGAVQRLTELAAKRDAAFSGSRWAIVADQDVIFGMARMYEMMRSQAPYEIRVFRAIEDARGWLQVPAGEPRDG